MTYKIESLCSQENICTWYINGICVYGVHLLNSFCELNHDLFDQAFINYNELHMYTYNCSIQIKLFFSLVSFHNLDFA